MSLIGECFKAEHYKLERLDYVDSSGVIVGCVLRQPRCVCVCRHTHRYAQALYCMTDRCHVTQLVCALDFPGEICVWRVHFSFSLNVLLRCKILPGSQVPLLTDDLFFCDQFLFIHFLAGNIWWAQLDPIAGHDLLHSCVIAIVQSSSLSLGFTVYKIINTFHNYRSYSI